MVATICRARIRGGKNCTDRATVGHSDVYVHVRVRNGAAVGRIVRWNETIADSVQKIGRPRQLFIGKTPSWAKAIARR